jgi:hypothetical protein
MCGRIESSVCWSVLLAGSETAVDPAAHVPVLLAEVTALFAVEGTHNDTDEADETTVGRVAASAFDAAIVTTERPAMRRNELRTIDLMSG